MRSSRADRHISFSRPDIINPLLIADPGPVSGTIKC
jgi:hypothetical protein